LCTANVVGLPQGSDLGGKVALESFQLGRGNRDAIKLLQQVRDAPPLEHDRAPCDLGRVRGEDRRDTDAAEKVVGPRSIETGLAKAAKRSAKIAALRGSVLVKLDGQPPPLAVVGLGEIDELEIKPEGAGKLIGSGEFKRADSVKSLLQMRGRGIGIILRVGLTAGDGSAAKRFDSFVDGVASLLAQDAAKEGAERANIAAKRCFFQVSSRCLEFSKALRPVRRSPKRRHDSTINQ
jgi:hypothetical protein